MTEAQTLNMKTLVVGFIPLLDCADLVAAAAKGFATAEGLDLRLVRETSWANIRDRTLFGQFDAAHMLGPMPLASTLGVGHIKAPLIAPMALNSGGNAITVSTGLWQALQQQGANTGGGPQALGAALRQVIEARRRTDAEPLTFAMVYPFSSHNYELRYWLGACGIDPDRDLRLVVIPPPFLADALGSGQIDGFCVGEPWNSVAVESGVGVILMPTGSIWPDCPEKVLGCRADWARQHAPQLQALLRALWRAGEWCADPAHHAELAELLAQPRHVGVPAPLLLRGLRGQFRFAADTHETRVPEFLKLAGAAALLPWSSHSLWYYAQMVRWRQVEHSPANLAAARGVFRPDLCRSALAPLNVELPSADQKTEHFFDGASFEPAAVETYLQRPRL